MGFFLFVLPGLAVLFAVTFSCIYMIPLMTDKKMGLIDAIKSSWTMAFANGLADHIVVVILFIGLMAIGTSVFIGTLLTQPFATVFLISVYLEKTGLGMNAPAQSPQPNTNGNR
jgi:membrane-anchored glycerophosphoryl diester phosphodiesterase (GDPDase)